MREHDRLLMGGVWAEIKLRYDDAYVFKGQNRPLFVESIRPIQLSNRNIERFIEGRKRFTRDQWLDLLMRSMGYEPNHPYYTKRRKLHYLQRLVPLVERNYNSDRARTTWHGQELRLPAAQPVLPPRLRRPDDDGADVREP